MGPGIEIVGVSITLRWSYEPIGEVWVVGGLGREDGRGSVVRDRSRHTLVSCRCQLACVRRVRGELVEFHCCVSKLVRIFEIKYYFYSAMLPEGHRENTNSTVIPNSTQIMTV